MACLVTIGNLLVWLVIVLAGITILRILLAAIAGIGWWPTVPTVVGQPQPAAAQPASVFARIVGIIVQILDVVFWAVVVIALIWFVIDVIGCLGGLRLGSPFR